MLEQLRILNLAVIDQAQIEFGEGLNILSGETGAGKSIVLTAVSLLLGTRGSSDLIRAGSQEATIEGYFSLQSLPWMKNRLESLGFSTNDSALLIKRVLQASGKNKLFINGSLATLNMLQDLCEGLVDLCGQHEHQSLMKAQTQLELLDRYGKLEDSARELRNLQEKEKALCIERSTLEKNQQEMIRRREFLQFQIEELNSAALVPGEEAGLQEQKKLLQSAKTRLDLLHAIKTFTEAGHEENQPSVMELLQKIKSKLTHLLEIDESAQEMVLAVERAIAEVEVLAEYAENYERKVESNPEMLESFQMRLDLISKLKKKFSSDFEGLIPLKESFEREYKSLGTQEERAQDLKKELSTLQTEIEKRGRQLSKKRKSVAEAFSKAITNELKELKMQHAQFKVQIEEIPNLENWSLRSGPNILEFWVQTNQGEDFKPLNKIVSGGELSRILLGIRRVITDRGQIGVYLFDEIDAGIGGQTAFQVGKKLKSVSRYNQVICITHLPQVASFADHHLKVQKHTQGKRTQTRIAVLDTRGKREEVARMLGGAKITQTSIKNADELIRSASTVLKSREHPQSNRV